VLQAQYPYCTANADLHACPCQLLCWLCRKMPDELQITPDPPGELVQVHHMRVVLLVRLNNAYALNQLCFQNLQGLHCKCRVRSTSAVIKNKKNSFSSCILSSLACFNLCTSPPTHQCCHIIRCAPWACMHTSSVSCGVPDDLSCCEGATPLYRHFLFEMPHLHQTLSLLAAFHSIDCHVPDSALPISQYVPSSIL